MSLFSRTTVALAGSLPRQARGGEGAVGLAIVPTIIATDVALTLTVAQMATGLVQFSSFTAARAVTTPTAALILAAAPDMDIGDSFSFFVSCQAAFAATWTAGTGVTLTGRATTPASSWSLVTVTKTSATAVSWNVS